MEAIKNDIVAMGPESILIGAAEDQYPVDARKLWTFLKVKTEFTKWFRDRAERFGFNEVSDYSPFLTIATHSAKPLSGFRLTLRMAQHLCMVEWTDKGRVARDYFIECEDRLRAVVAGELPPAKAAHLKLIEAEHKVAPILLESNMMAAKLLGTPETLARAIAVQAVSSQLPNVDFKGFLTANISDIQERLLTPTDIGKGLGLSAIAVNKKLRAHGFQSDESGTWALTELGKAYGVYLDTGKKRSNGVPVQQIKWKESVLKELQAGIA